MICNSTICSTTFLAWVNCIPVFVVVIFLHFFFTFDYYIKNIIWNQEKVFDFLCDWIFCDYAGTNTFALRSEYVQVLQTDCAHVCVYVFALRCELERTKKNVSKIKVKQATSKVIQCKAKHDTMLFYILSEENFLLLVWTQKSIGTKMSMRYDKILKCRILCAWICCDDFFFTVTLDKSTISLWKRKKKSFLFIMNAHIIPLHRSMATNAILCSNKPVSYLSFSSSTTYKIQSFGCYYQLCCVDGKAIIESIEPFTITQAHTHTRERWRIYQYRKTIDNLSYCKNSVANIYCEFLTLSIINEKIIWEKSHIVRCEHQNCWYST